MVQWGQNSIGKYSREGVHVKIGYISQKNLQSIVLLRIIIKLVFFVHFLKTYSLDIVFKINFKTVFINMKLIKVTPLYEKTNKKH